MMSETNSAGDDQQRPEVRPTLLEMLHQYVKQYVEPSVELSVKQYVEWAQQQGTGSPQEGRSQRRPR